MNCIVSEIGMLGQNAVEILLLSKGYCHIQTNVRKGQYEFDIIASKRGISAVFEVRTTTKSRLPFEIFPTHKVLTVLAGANRYYPRSLVIFAHVLYKQESKVITTWYTSQDLL